MFPSASPGASSGSFDVAETSVTAGDGSKSSAAAIVACTVAYLWFGGHRLSGDSDTSIVGAISSHESMPTRTASWSDERNSFGSYSASWAGCLNVMS